MELNLELPLGAVSFGQLSYLLLHQLFERKIDVNLFPIGQVDASTQKIDKEFGEWIQASINRANSKFNRNNPSLKIWHLSGSHNTIGENNTLLSFYECDQPTPEEINIIKNNKKVVFTNDYTVDIFKQAGCDNVSKIPLAFDKYNFYKTNKKYFWDGRISFLLPGKAELTRKRTAKVIQAWAERFGNDKRYFLNCAVWNLFLKPEDNQKLFNDILGGKRYWNIQALPFMQNNALYCDLLNSCEICIGMGTEGWNLPLMSHLCLGGVGVALNVAGHKEFCTNENSVLVEPSGKIEIFDQMFFHKGQKWNQGFCYDFDNQAFIHACEQAIERVKNNPKTENSGLELQKKFSPENMVNKLIEKMLE